MNQLSVPSQNQSEKKPAAILNFNNVQVVIRVRPLTDSYQQGAAGLINGKLVHLCEHRCSHSAFEHFPRSKLVHDWSRHQRGPY